MALKYRPEIDGLRAVAVCSVILYHAGIHTFSGGYIGVDVFFVISGFLITSIIFKELKVQKFSFSYFYERRARRILPALFLIMLVSIPFSWFWMSPPQLKEYSESVVSAQFFVSNFFFWMNSGYFGGDAELSPLLHTWSLSIEEQYYLIFPPFLLFCMKYFKDRFVSILFLIMSISFFYSQFGGNLHLSDPYVEPIWRWFSDNNATFYLIFSRGWELLIGVLVACHMQKNREYSIELNQVLSIIGLALIISPMFLYNRLVS